MIECLNPPKSLTATVNNKQNQLKEEYEKFHFQAPDTMWEFIEVLAEQEFKKPKCDHYVIKWLY